MYHPTILARSAGREAGDRRCQRPVRGGGASLGCCVRPPDRRRSAGFARPSSVSALSPTRAATWSSRAARLRRARSSGRPRTGKLTAAEAHAWGLVSEVVEADAPPARAAELAGFYAGPRRGAVATKAPPRSRRRRDPRSAARAGGAAAAGRDRGPPTSPRAFRPSSRSARRASRELASSLEHLVLLGEAPLALLREDELAVEEHVELALLALDRRSVMPWG